MSVIARAVPVNIPELNLNKARVLAYWWEEGAKKPDRKVKFDDALKDLEKRYNCAFWHDAQALRDTGTPELLRYEPFRAEDNLLFLEETHFINPKPLWDAINAAEKAAGLKPTPIPGKAVKGSAPDVGPLEAAPTHKVGDTIMQGGVLHQLVEDQGGKLMLEPIPVGSAAASTPTAPGFPGANKTPETMSMQELRIGCKAAGLSAGGSANELRERLKAHNAKPAAPAEPVVVE